MKSTKPKKSPRKGNTPVPSTSQRSFLRWTLIALAVLGATGFILWRNQSPRTEPMPSASAPEPDVSTNASTIATQAPVSFQKLKGKWLRPDGGYIIDVRNVEDSGKLNASYFNPNPINVSKAQASQEGSATKVFIELRDVNYPGSTYTLTYLPERDLLVGIYYQALQQQSFEVYFERMK